MVVVVFRKNKAYNMPILSGRENEQQTERERRNTGVTKEIKDAEFGGFLFFNKKL